MHKTSKLSLKHKEILGGRLVSSRLVTWLISWCYLVRILRKMNLYLFDIGGFISLGLVEELLVGWFVWVVVLPHELGGHVFLARPGTCHVVWLLLSLGWVCAHVI